MKLVVFAGQGSQFKGMGKSLFLQFPEETAKASEILGYDIRALCLSGPKKQLNLTQFTQPALYVVNALNWLAKQESIGKIDYLMGHSLGEYNALFAAGAFDFETGLKLVKERGLLMGNASKGRMLAVLGLTKPELEDFLRQKKLTELEIANYNTATQLILSGPEKIIEKAVKKLTKKNIKAIILNVSAAFHSSFMKESADIFTMFLHEFSFSPLSIPVIANSTARPYDNNQITKTLSRQIDSPVLWSESIRYLMAREKNFKFIEIAEKPVLSKMITSIQTNEEPLFQSPEELKANEMTGDIPEIPAAQVPENNIPSSSEGTSESKELFKAKDLCNEPSMPDKLSLAPEKLGSKSFQQRYGIKYSYLTGAMYRGVASKELVICMAKAGLLGFLGTGGLRLDEIEEDLIFIKNELDNGQVYGMNLLSNLYNPQMEMETIELYLKHGVTIVEAAAYMMMTPALVYFRVKGLEKNKNGRIRCKHKIIAKISRPEVAATFLAPPPKRIVKKLLNEGKINQEQAEMAKNIAMSFDLCVEADSGGHTDQGIPTVLLPSIQSLRKEIIKKHNYQDQIHIGLAGGIGTPQAAASAFIMGADFILTGSINQCTVEAGTSDLVKSMLQEINVQDTDYAPAGDMFEIGARVQVLKLGVFFPARANKLFMLYNHYNSLEEIPANIKKQLENKYFKKSFQEIWEETKEFFHKREDLATLEKAENNPKHKMALIFRWYFGYSSRIAAAGDKKNQIDFQVHTGPALGAFNQWVKGTVLEQWKNRHVDKIGEKLMNETVQLLEERVKSFY
jgi:trans-AT polyketide synthase, acyltransferase and oxidoreductase domains